MSKQNIRFGNIPIMQSLVFRSQVFTIILPSREKSFLKKIYKDFLRCLKMHRTSSASTFEVLTWRFFSHITQEICQNSPLWIFLKKLKKKLGVDERFTIFSLISSRISTMGNLDRSPG